MKDTHHGGTDGKDCGMILIIHIDDPGDIIGIKEAIASRLEDLGGVRVEVTQ